MKRNLLILAVLLVGTCITVAQIPQTMSYQGRLTDAGGVAVANGNYSLTFTLWDAAGSGNPPVGGNLLWTETQASVAVSGGIFNVILGSVTPFGLGFDQPYWLMISVQGTTLAPRTALSASPYSIRSLGVSGTNNIFPPSNNVGIGTTSPSYKLTVKGSGNEVYSVMSEDGTQTPDNLTVQIAPGSGTSTTRIGYLMGNFGNTSSGFLIANTRSAPLRFATGGGGSPIEAMRIDASGNVGIGTTSPAQRLDVYSTGTYCMTRVVSNDGSKGQVTVYNSGELLLNSYTTGGFSPGSIRICPGDVLDSRSVYITSTGQVGVGTTSPARRLDVRDGSGAGGYGGAIQVGAQAASADPKLIYFGDASYVSIGENVADDRMELTASTFVFNTGSVGIGVVPSGYKLQVNGSAANLSGVWVNYSDRRLKTDIQPLQNALRTVDQLQGVTFRWKDAKKDLEYGRVRGLVAQDVEKVIPEWVKTGSDGYKSLEPIGEFALLMEAVKELNTKNKELSTKNEKLEARLAELEVIVKSLAATKTSGGNKSVGELR